MPTNLSTPTTNASVDRLALAVDSPRGAEAAQNMCAGCSCVCFEAEASSQTPTGVGCFCLEGV